MKRLLALLILALATGILAAAAQDDKFEPGPELEAQMAELEQMTITIRGLEGEPVERAFPTRPEVVAYLTEQIDIHVPIEEMDRYERFYVALDLLDPEVNLREVYLALLGAQVAGFYDTETQIMNVVPLTGAMADTLTPLQAVTYVHEFTHALQDQFFGLDQFLEAEEATDNFDRGLASLSLVEGDANLVMTIFLEHLLQRNPMAALSMLGEGLLAGGLTLPRGTPPILARELLFPYEEGMEFVLALHREGGWELIDSAYLKPPTATEQILHPDRFIAGELPVDVQLLDTVPALGENWTRIWDTTLGEWYLREHLRTELGRAEAFDAAEGWGGDRLHIYHNLEKDELAWLLHVVWDTPVDAAEFEKSYSDFAALRYDSEPLNGCWRDLESATCMIATQDATLVARAPSQEQAIAMLAAQD